MTLRNLVLSGIILCTAQVWCQDHYKERYSIDPLIGKLLDSHSKLIANKLIEVDEGSKKHGVWKFEWLPGYYVKYGLARIAGMEKMREAITRCNLTSLILPDKRIYHVKGTPETLSNSNYAIVIKSVEAADNVAPITVDEIKQLCTLMHETGYISMTGTLNDKGPNYIRTAEGKFCFIDTESRYEHKNLLKGFLRLLDTHDFNKDLSKEALQFVFGEIRRLLVKQPAQIPGTYEKLMHTITTQKSPASWDYETYFRKHFKKLLKAEGYL